MTNVQLEGAGRATAKYLHVSSYKVRQVLELVKGLPVEDAGRVLSLCEKDAADDVAKVLNSALANATHNHAHDPEELFVKGAWADEGPTRKWGQARARGRYFRIRKRTTHLTIVLDRFQMDELETRRRRDEQSGRGSGATQRSRAERVRRSRQAQGDEAKSEEVKSEEVEAEVDEAPVEELAAAEVEAPEAEAAVEAVAETAADETPVADEAEGAEE
jgi:large subunit ribosomal protein L22